jgi:hypothetical protein
MTQRFAHTAAIAVVAAFSLGAAAMAAQLGQTKPADGTSVDELLTTARLDEIRKKRDAYEAERLVARAVREELRARDEEAEKFYARAVELDPENERAVIGLRSARDRLGLHTDPEPLIERAERELRTKRQEVLFRFDAALSEAVDAIDTGRTEGFTTARLQLDRARLIRALNPGVFSAEEYERLDARVRDKDLALTRAIQRRNDVIRAAQERDWARRIKAARVHDKRL